LPEKSTGSFRELPELVMTVSEEFDAKIAELAK
jgi:hypothetical protein